VSNCSFLAWLVLSLLQTWLEVPLSPFVQPNISLPFILVLSTGPLWSVISLLVLDEGGLRSHQLVYGVGQAHLPTLVLLMEGVQWILHSWSEGPIVPLSDLS
jgi:hypothetical protein